MTGDIFVVEDQRDFVDIYQRIFDRMGLRMAGWARSGEEAIEKLAKLAKRPEQIIMDNLLPGMSGVDTTIKILEIDPMTSVLFVSVDERAKQLALRSGAIGFLEKPFLLEDFISYVKSAVESDRRIPLRAK